MKDRGFVLYAYTFRSRAERVLWALRELDHPYEVIRLDPFKGDAVIRKKEMHRGISKCGPMGTII